MKKSVFALLAICVGFASCEKDDDIDGGDKNPEVVVPQNYTFERDGESTVNYSGQTTRLAMASELMGSFNDFENADESLLLNMFRNENNPFSNEDLNASSKSIKSKIAASNLYFSANTTESNAIKADFEWFITEQMNTVKPNKDQLAEPGIPGQIASGTSVRYVDGKGLEMNQAFAKGLMGALLADQMLNNYLSAPVLDEANNRENNTMGVTEEGKNYTTMEHKWDEAYGYLYGDASIPTANPNSVLGQSNDRLLFNYIAQVDADSDFSGIVEETFNAFKTGRAAIVAGDYELRDEQAAIIRENISLILAVRAVHYLQGGKLALADENYASAFHELSEGYGFIYGLRFSHNPSTGMPYLSKSEVDEITEGLLEGNGFWDVTAEELDMYSETIASAFGFTVAEAAE